MLLTNLGEAQRFGSYYAYVELFLAGYAIYLPDFLLSQPFLLLVSVFTKVFPIGYAQGFPFV
jgi:hypothetical protein